MDPRDWLNVLTEAASGHDAWEAVFRRLLDMATEGPTPGDLQSQTVAPDRLLAESAWELWQEYPRTAPRTSQQLRSWWVAPSPHGRAVLVLDALSLRELRPLLAGADAHGITPAGVQVVGAEVPSDTDQFAAALGVPSRASLASNGASSGFALAADNPYTDVLRLPFEDSVADIPHDADLFLWHAWLDDQIHVFKRSPDQVSKIASEGLKSPGFWALVDKLRQGRRLVITGDHGYAVSDQFSTPERDPQVADLLKTVFGASRYTVATEPWQHRSMPPLVVTENGHHVVIGQRKWTVQGGFPKLCHGGLSLLEVAVPFVELPAL